MIDNSGLAVISVIMLGLGFVAGSAVGPTIKLLKLEEELTIVKGYYEYLLTKYDEYDELFTVISQRPLHLPPKRFNRKMKPVENTELKLDPPNTPLIRSSHYIDESVPTVNYEGKVTPCEFRLDKMD